MIPRRKNRKSILLFAIATLWLTYVGIVSAEYYFNITSRVDREVQSRKKDVDFVLEFSGSLIIKDNVETLLERLKQAREFRMVDFYILQKKDKVVAYYNKQNNPDELNQAYTELNTFVESEDVTYKTIQIYDYRLTVGVNTAKKSLSRVFFGEQKYLILHNLAVISIFAMALIYFVQKEALSFTKLRGGQKPESETPLKSVVPLKPLVQKIKENEKALLAPALLHELKSNTAIPTSFESTVVRLDLTKETQISLGLSEQMSSILHKFNHAATELVGRYGGFICESTGTEIVFHFKGIRKVTEPIAVACVRSIFELGSETERTLPATAGNKFTLTAGLSSGTVHFTKISDVYNLSGTPFTEAGKALAHAPEGVINSSLIMAESSKEFVTRVCRLAALNNDYYMVDDFISLEKVFAADKAEYCTYYRSDLNLMALMKYLEKLVENQEEKLYFRVFADLKHVKTNVICSDVEKAFTHFLEFTYRKSHDQPVDPKVLSAAVSLTTNLIPQGSGSEKMTEILKLYLQFADPRVQANAVSVLGEVPSNVRFLKKFIHSDHNRLSADALVVTGKQVVDKELVTRVRTLLRSSNKVHQASGRYVALKLVEHYKQSDMQYYNTNPHLKKLEELLGKVA